VTKGHTPDGTTEPLVEEVVGAVHPSGASGGAEGGAEGQVTRWTLQLSFGPWRRIGGPVEDTELWLYQPGLTHDELRERMAAFRPYDIFRARVRFRPGGNEQVQLADLVTTPEPAADDELGARVKELQVPVTVPHPTLGTFTLDRRVDWFKVTTDWNGRSVQLSLSRRGCNDEQELFRTAETLWAGQESWDRQVRAFASSRLLDLKNDTWLEDGENEVTTTEFEARMALEGVFVFPSRQFEFTFHDDGLFWGHVIQVSGTLADGLTHAGIAG